MIFFENCQVATTGTIECTAGSGQPQSVRTADNIAAIEELVQSQEDKPQTDVNQTNLQTAQNSANDGKAHYPQRFKTQMLEKKTGSRTGSRLDGSGTTHC